MEKRTAFVLTFLWLAAAAGAEDKPRAPVYTNEDLARMAPLRGETGVLSKPSAAPAASKGAAREADGDTDRRRSSKGPDYWQKEADKVRERVRPLEKQAAALKRKIDERWRLPGVQPTTDPQLLVWRRELKETEADIRELQERLDERARKDGALPGWLR